MRNHSRSARGDAETALRLARHFGSSAAIWLRLQVAYDLSHAEAEFPAKIAAEVTPRCRVIERSYRDGDNEIAAIAL